MVNFIEQIWNLAQAADAKTLDSTICCVMPLMFIPPAAPVPGPNPPRGPDWLHEIKWDGWRCQIIKDENGVRIYSRSMTEWTDRLPTVAAAIQEIPARSMIIDGELISNAGDFYDIPTAIKWRRVAFAAFDLLHHNGNDLRRMPLTGRKQSLAKLLVKSREPIILSEVFDDGEALLKAANDHRLEGIVSKLRNQSYVSGNNRGWIKVKTPRWRADNADRGERFAKKA